ncbi:zinc ribbon domain-containing protein [Nostoc sp.]|uniref:zinc ribbon domain-containing protein n=1 Tax=Nostoc sp. TaxID=1180 RepID=UPI002FFCDEA6
MTLQAQLGFLAFSLICVPLLIIPIIHYFNNKIGYPFNEGVLNALEKGTDEMLCKANYWLLLTIAVAQTSIIFGSTDKWESLFAVIFAWLIGLIPGFIAYNKGRNFYNWWMYGHLMFIFALPHALLLKETENSMINKGIYKICPYCAETVKKEATVCKHCGNALV